MASPCTLIVLSVGEISWPISRSPSPITATGWVDAGPSRSRPALRSPAMKPIACASLAANTASTSGSRACAATLPEALRSRINLRGSARPLASASSLKPSQRRVPRGSSPPMKASCLASLRSQMLRDGGAGLVIVEAPRPHRSGWPADPRSRRSECARCAAGGCPPPVAGEPTMMIASGRRDSSAASMRSSRAAS